MGIVMPNYCITDRACLDMFRPLATDTPQCPYSACSIHGIALFIFTVICSTIFLALSCLSTADADNSRDKSNFVFTTYFLKYPFSGCSWQQRTSRSSRSPRRRSARTKSKLFKHLHLYLLFSRKEKYSIKMCDHAYRYVCFVFTLHQKQVIQQVTEKYSVFILQNSRNISANQP